MSSCIAYNKTLITAPAAEPISTADAKEWLYVTGADHDTLIDGLVASARQYIETEKDGALITQTWDFYLDSFPANGVPIHLNIYPAASITSISYYDAAGDLQTWDSANYSLFLPDKQPPVIVPTVDTDYPETQDRTNAVIIRVVAGWGASGANLPKGMITALKMLVKYWYDNPEDGPTRGRPWERSAKLIVNNLFPISL